MVVVESRSPRPMWVTSPWVTVLSGEDLERRQIHSLADALRTVPGMAVVRTGQAGAQTALFSRSSESNHVTFLLDGRKLNGGFSGLYNLGQLSLTGLSGLEVLRGSSSTLYGAEGIGGVVMLRSGRAPVDGVSSTMGLSGGSFGTLLGNLQTTFREGDWSGNIGLSGTNTDNDLPNAGYWNHSGVLGLERMLSKEWSIDFLGMGYRTDLGLSGAAYRPTPTDSQDTKQYLLSPGILCEDDGWRFQSHYSFSKDDLEYFSPTNQTRSWTEQEEIDSQFDWEWKEFLSVTFGVSYTTQRFLQDGSSVSEVPPTWKEGDGWEKVSGFGLLRYVPSSAFELSGGLRAEDYSDYGSPITWTLSSRRSLTGSVSFFGRYSTGFSPPTALELYGIGPFYAGNQNLKPEESEAWELGLLIVNDRSDDEVRLTYFDNRFTNLIQGNPAENLRSGSAKGVELSFIWSVADGWQLKGSYAYLDALNKDSGEGFLDRRPKHSGSIGLEHSNESTVVGAEMVFRTETKEMDWDWVSSSPTYESWISADDYAVARLYAEHEWKEGLGLFGRVENLFDEEYEEVDGYPALGIGVFGGLRYSF